MLLQHKKAPEFGLHLVEIKQIQDVDTLVNQIAKVSKKYLNDDARKEKDLQNEAKGNLFEIFGEYLIRTLGGDALLPIDRDTYNPNNPMDGGVDGDGQYNGHPAVVQFKYRNPWADPGIEYSEISTFFRQAVCKFKVDPEKFHEQAMVITCGRGYNDYEKELGDVHPLLVNYDTLKLKIGANNPEFWAGFVAAVEDTYNEAKFTPTIAPLWEHQQQAVDEGLNWLSTPV